MSRQVPFFNIFQRAGRRFGVDPRLLMAVAKQESGFNPNAESHAGAQGVMQIMPDTGRALGLKDPFDAEQSIMAGAAYMGKLLQRFDGSVEKALAAYNWGPNRKALASQDENWLSKAPRETRDYVPAVMAHMEQFSPDVDTRTARRARPQQPIQPAQAQRLEPEQPAELSPLDRRLTQMAETHPEALDFLRAADKPPKLEALDAKQRMALQAGAVMFGEEPQTIIDRAWELARLEPATAEQKSGRFAGDPRKFFSDLTAARGADVMMGRMTPSVPPFNRKSPSTMPRQQQRQGPGAMRASAEGMDTLGGVFLPALGGSQEERPPPQVEMAPHPQPSRQEFPVPKQQSRVIEAVMRMVAERRQRRGNGRMMG